MQLAHPPIYDPEGIKELEVSPHPSNRVGPSVSQGRQRSPQRSDRVNPPLWRFPFKVRGIVNCLLITCNDECTWVSVCLWRVPLAVKLYWSGCGRVSSLTLMNSALTWNWPRALSWPQAPTDPWLTPPGVVRQDWVWDLGGGGGSSNGILNLSPPINCKI